MSNAEQMFLSNAKIWQHLVEQAQIAWEAKDFARANDLFEKFQNHSMPWLLSIAYRELPNDENSILAEDLVAEAYFQLWQIVESGKTIENAKGLVGTILRRRIADFYRKQNTQKEKILKLFYDKQVQMLASEQVNPAEIVEKDETKRYVTNIILDALSPQERDVLLARHIDELTVAQTASRLGLTKDQVKKRTQKAIRKAKKIAAERGLLNDVS